MSLALRVASSPPDAGGSTPFNYFLHSHGLASGPTLYLGWVLAAICVAVCLLIAGLLAYAVWRRRPVSERDVVGDPGRSLRWVGIGTGLSTLVLFGLAAYALTVLAEVGAPPRAAALTVAVTGYDWWWRIDYGSGDGDGNGNGNGNGRGDGAQRFTTANELHIPVGVPVRVRLDSADVIHAFWVPQLAGKTQMIPGVTNEQWLQADAPGLYRGQCTQFCGAQHAHMAFDVIAQTPADFAAWRARQQQGAAPDLAATRPSSDLASAQPSSDLAAAQPSSNLAAAQPSSDVRPMQPSLFRAGHALFMDRCAGCHAVRGTDARGEHGPDLSHLLGRRMLGAGLLTNTAAHRIDWVTRVQNFKPGARMPNMALTTTERAELSAYLDTLQ